MEAHNLKVENKFTVARKLMTEPVLPGANMNRVKGHLMAHERMSLFTDEQKDAMRVARATNDFETMHEIMREAGVDEGNNFKGEMKKNWRNWN